MRKGSLTVVLKHFIQSLAHWDSPLLVNAHTHDVYMINQRINSSAWGYSTYKLTLQLGQVYPAGAVFVGRLEA